MASSGVNVLRWSALGFGVIYGLYHQTSITAMDKFKESQKDYERREKLINEAKAAFSKKNAPSSGSSSNIITDPEDPKFDLEKYLTTVPN